MVVPSLMKFQDEAYINGLLGEATRASVEEISRILDKAESFQGLTPREVAVLLVKPEETLRLFDVARKIKEHIYGDRMVIFAPLYISDYCVNDCVYCGFRRSHPYPRRKLTLEEIKNEAEILTRMGHKRLALEAGEDPTHSGIAYVLEAIKVLYENDIRRVNVNIAATTVENYRKLKAANIGTYILFQETYHRLTYEKMHLSGPKADYDWHASAFDRAMQAGIDDVGGGVLFGLHDWRYEALALMLHNQYLEETFGVGFHTISLPRIRPTERTGKKSGAGFVEGETTDEAAQSAWPYAVSDTDFLRLTAILRLAVPYTGMIISTRETAVMRKQLITCGVSQLSGGSVVEVGGYALQEKGNSQFEMADNRNAQEILYWLMEEDLIPSFCTACYRNNRTGDRFMGLAKSGEIKHVCLPNALMTLAEYAADYGSELFKEKAAGLIARKTADIKDEKLKQYIQDNIARINMGERDLFV